MDSEVIQPSQPSCYGGVGSRRMTRSIHPELIAAYHHSKSAKKKAVSFCLLTAFDWKQ
jgi:hypothetical protein